MQHMGHTPIGTIDALCCRQLEIVPCFCEIELSATGIQMHVASIILSDGITVCSSCFESFIGSLEISRLPFAVCIQLAS